MIKQIFGLSKTFITPSYRYSQVYENVQILNTVKTAVFDVLNQQTEWRKEKLSETATFEELGFDSSDSNYIAVEVEDKLNLDDVFDFDKTFTSVSETIRYFYDHLVVQDQYQKKYQQELDQVKTNALEFLKEHEFIRQKQFTPDTTFEELGLEFYQLCQLMEAVTIKLNIPVDPLDNLDIEKVSDTIRLLQRQKLRELKHADKVEQQEVQKAEEEKKDHHDHADHH